MGEALEVQGRAGVQGEFACQKLSVNDVEAYWPQMLLELRKIRHTWDLWWTEDTLYLQAISGHMQVWVAGKPPDFNLVLFTQVLNYPANSILQAVLMFGNKVEETLPVVIGTLEHYAAMSGCRYAEVFGRPGWMKKLNSYGFRQSAVVLSKPVGELRRH